MKIIVGLGNPGKKYEKTRHNVGFMFVEYLVGALEAGDFAYKKKFESEVAEVGRDGDKVFLVKPQTFMNDVGRAVSKVANYYGVGSEDLIIAHDDLDIEFGEFKIQKGRGPKDHNGLLSVEEKLGYKDFTRIRIGVDARKEEYRGLGRDYVLMDFSENELKKLKELFTQIKIT